MSEIIDKGTNTNTLDLKHWRIRVDEQDIAWLTIDKSGAEQNALSRDVIEELALALDRIDEERPKGLVLCSGKKNSFIVGADISEFKTLADEAEALELIQYAHTIFQRIDDMRIPTVAMVNGHCLGGGLELALTCRYRVAVDNTSTRIGLPEVLLGIHPGFGGTARLIRTIGVPSAMNMMLTGRSLRSRQAKSMGVVDKAVPERHLKRAARLMIERKPKPRRAPGWQSIMSAGVSRPLMAKFLRKQVAAKASPKHYPAPYALIDLWEKHGGDEREMLDQEARSVGRLITGDTAQNLVRVFFLQEDMKSLGKPAEGERQEKFEHVHVIGAGVMGGDIAAWCAAQGLRVTIQDQNPEALARVVKRAHELFKKRLRDRRLVQAAMDRFMPDVAGDGVRRADVVIEAIFENAEAKQDLFKGIEPNLKDNAILATNTSSIPLESLCSVLAKPERLVGLHFFNPVAKMQLVEIVVGEATADNENKRAAIFARQINRLPIPVKSSPGFLVNRVLMPYLMEAVELSNEGMPASVIDNIATEFGMPMGPIELADTVGLDICLHVAKNLTDSFGGEVPYVLQAKVDNGQLGKKSARGFYTWKNGKPVKSSPPKDYEIPGDTTNRMVLRFLNESVACLREGVVSDSDLLDAGIIFGTGFAPFRGGPMHYIATEGQQRLLGRLNQFAEKYGERFKPDAGWESLDLDRKSAET
ncbi:MAG: 3-hydroxyacyl-CoA dehydrogenase NAD-binding domain-containing protein [Gammaproteobacteria bacterium]|nr:3-hydroxyacyl-CoA dehydrogenase NAD-binding domain-containing protein [Gammaproteobacteria bacterium]